MTENGKTTAMAKASPATTIRELLVKNKAQISMALPKHMDADRLTRIALTACQKTPKLLQCTPVSLLGAVIQCAQLGLEPNDGTGKAWILPYGDIVQFIPGYKGLIQLARNSGDVKTVEAHAVYEKDEFDYSFGIEQILRHVPSREADRGQITHLYAIARMTDGSVQFDVMTKAEVDAIRKRSKAANNGPWVTDYEEMGKKTVVRRLCKYLPASSERANNLQKAITLDERLDAGLPQNLATLVDPTAFDEPEAAEDDDMPKRASEAAEAPKPADGREAEVYTGQLSSLSEVKKGSLWELVDVEGVIYQIRNKVFADKAKEILANKSMAKVAFLSNGPDRAVGLVEAIPGK
jgi:recombination protein RecT